MAELWKQPFIRKDVTSTLNNMRDCLMTLSLCWDVSYSQAETLNRLLDPQGKKYNLLLSQKRR